jgi:hypothetical protein
MLRSEGSETNRQTLPENSLFLSDEKQKPTGPTGKSVR